MPVSACDFRCPYLQILVLDLHALVHSFIDSLNHMQRAIFTVDPPTYEQVQVNPHTGLPKIVKGVPERVTRPTGGWTHGKGKAKKRLILHSKRLQTQTLVSVAAEPAHCAVLALDARAGRAVADFSTVQELKGLEK